MSIEIDHLTKQFANEVVVDNLSLQIKSGELFVLLGSSGSGKTTMLRMIAGLEEVDQGTIRLHGRDVTRLSPRDRCIGMVFQHYALFGNMTVAANVEFALSIRGVSSLKRRDRREELLKLVGLSGFGDRFPHQLSGGQRQRVALARALAHEPKVLLLDEPFGALDAKIRTELRQSLRRIQRELSLTTVFVTHDQEEAFQVADRLAIMHEGRLLEVGNPFEIYHRPRSAFVATFLGAANILIGESLKNGIRLGQADFPLKTEIVNGHKPKRVQVLIRPEDVELTSSGNHVFPFLGTGIVEECLFAGPYEKIRLRIPLTPPLRPVVPPPILGDEWFFVDALRSQGASVENPLKVGDMTSVTVRRFHILAPASLRLLVENGPSTAAKAAYELGKGLAARLGAHIQTIGSIPEEVFDSENLTEGASATTESGAKGFDIAVLAMHPKDLPRKMGGLIPSRHHLLLVSSPCSVPSRVLICVAAGEPGKADVRFSERLAWQLGAQTTVLTVLPARFENSGPPAHVSEFLETCQRGLSARGVVARSRIRYGSLIQEIKREIEEGNHDLLVVGAPLPSQNVKTSTMAGAVEDLLHMTLSCPILIVRNQTAS